MHYIIVNILHDYTVYLLQVTVYNVLAICVRIIHGYIYMLTHGLETCIVITLKCINDPCNTMSQ